MYSSTKRIVRKIIPNGLFFKMEPFLRQLYSFSKKGNNHLCGICNFKMKEWVKLPNEDDLCPNCGSLSRDRRLYHVLKEEYLLKNINILDFSPSRTLFRRLKKESKIKYTASDLSGNFIADVQYNMTAISQEDNTYDLIICYHVLEHITDDKKAMSELYRVLKNNGKILIQTPFKEGEIYEDLTIISEKDRLKHFGQEDHVRIYSVNGLQQRLKKVGFTIEIKNYSENEYYGFSKNEIILIAKK